MTDPARELDRTVAERRGYRHNGDLWEYDTPYGFPAVVEDYPHYSTDLDAAWTLFDTASEDYTPRVVRILTPLNGKLVYQWKCNIMPNIGDDEPDYEGIADTPALAIVRAWLAYTAPAPGPASP